MGKLHTLKRAIKRSPEKWYWINLSGICYARGAYLFKNEWHSISNPSYRKFVAKVLKEIYQSEFIA